MFTKLFTYCCILLFISIACEQQTVWEFNNTTPHVVVDALITSEFKAQELCIYESPGGLNEGIKPILEANVLLTNGIDSFYFKADGPEGRYTSAPFAAAVGETYILVVEINGQIDTAYAQMHPITPFKNDTVYINDGFYRFIYGGSDLPAMTEVYYDWSNNENYCEEYGNCYAKTVHYTLNNIDISQEFGPERQEIWFPPGTTLIRRKYSLSSEHEKFIRSLLLETEWRGGLFDVEQGNVPTNFKNGLKGWFGVCMVISDTVTVN